jgi:hypothetical protein
LVVGLLGWLLVCLADCLFALLGCLAAGLFGGLRYFSSTACRATLVSQNPLLCYFEFFAWLERLDSAFGYRLWLVRLVLLVRRGRYNRYKT